MIKEINHKYNTFQNNSVEITIETLKKYNDPFNDVEIDLVFKNPVGEKLVVPAFWADKNLWKARYSSPIKGTHKFTIKCSDDENTELQTTSGVVTISEYYGINSLYRRGGLKISSNGKYLEHFDGTPFFWLGDTWGHGLVKRCRWPEDFKLLIKDRVKKGYTVIQIVAGLYYDTKSFNDYGANESGWPWNENFTTINPSYFDNADKRIEYLIEVGLIPCIVGAWGYHLYFHIMEVI
ncbi:MAG: DUF4038 domain-containing protein [Actinobacteria bacterium]|nr:DUF4038 domain-containing protein [Actinomycetota bacterium]